MCGTSIEDAALKGWVNATSSVVPLVFDNLVFGITVYQTFRHGLEMRDYVGHNSITKALFRDENSPLNDSLIP